MHERLDALSQDSLTKTLLYFLDNFMTFSLKKCFILISLLWLTSCGPAFLQGTNTLPAKGDSKKEGQDKIEINFPKLGFVGHFSWLKGPFPSSSKESAFRIIFKDQKGNFTQLEPTYEFRVFIIMPSMGHGPADPGRFERLGPNVYVNKDLYFNMEGDWQIFVDVCMRNEDTCEGSNLIDSSSYFFEMGL